VSVRAGGGLHVCRGELRLARDAAQPLREVPLRPDPLSLFARVFDMLRSDLDEDATVAIDLLPASPQQRRRLRKRLLRQADRRGLAGWPARSNGSSSLGGILHDAARELGVDRGPRGGSPGNGRLSPVDLVSQRHELRQLSTKLLDVDAMFELQVLIRTRSRVPQRADAMFTGLLSAFEVFGADNEFTVSGINLFGAVFFGADAPWRKGWFDVRLERGYFRPAGRRAATSSTRARSPGCSSPPRATARTTTWSAPAPTSPLPRATCPPIGSGPACSPSAACCATASA
jgi:hypothetical protein